jgi:hypothetical protein
MKKISILTLLTVTSCLSSCDWQEGPQPPDGSTFFTQIESLSLTGGATAAEISAFDPKTKKLFVVNAVKSAIDVVNMQDPFNLVYEQEISILSYGSGVNSVSVKNGLLAAAIESNPKTDPGKVVVWNTADLTERAVVSVGALPDMVTFSPDGKFIVSANEGEPNENYTIDPNGSISIIRVPGFSATTLDFTSFNGQAASLLSKGFRMPGPAGTSLAQDTEPEYAAISADSRTAWVTLQENDAVARVDLLTKRIDKIFMLGYLDHSIASNTLDPSDRNGGVVYGNFPVKGLYLPDAIAAFQCAGSPLFITANEGDSRIRPTSNEALPPLKEGELFNEEARVKDVNLDTLAFPNWADLKTDTKLGRLKITKTLGDTDGDGDYDQLFSFGTRSFTIRNGLTNQIVYESGDGLEEYLRLQMPSLYDDGRSDDKGVEPESVTTGKIGLRTLAFVGLERSDAIVVVDVTNPHAPIYLQVLQTGDAPEGLIFIPANESPIGKPLLVSSCEGDGTIQVFTLSGEEEEFLN